MQIIEGGNYSHLLITKGTISRKKHNCMVYKSFQIAPNSQYVIFLRTKKQLIGRQSIQNIIKKVYTLLNRQINIKLINAKLSKISLIQQLQPAYDC